MTDLYRCHNCSRSYRADKLTECPRCYARPPGWADETRVKVNYGVELKNSSADDYAGSSLVVAAQDRTTHAVRSLAVFILVAISSALIGYVIIAASAGSALGCGMGISSCNANSGGAIFFGFAFIAVGFIVALILGIRELRLSNI
jgi:hypothetical protein